MDELKKKNTSNQALVGEIEEQAQEQLKEEINSLGQKYSKEEQVLESLKQHHE